MLIEYEDFNGADSFLKQKYSSEWVDIQEVLTAMSLHLKASDQAGIQGNPIFDPVGTNAFIKEALGMRGWSSNLAIPTEFSFLGTDVDYAKRGLLMEAQFSNYPFLLNNVVRSELFSKSGVSFDGDPIEVVVIVTKARMFPASNSTLYYEQAVNQLKELAKHDVFDVPMRVVGLKEIIGQGVNACWTEYHASRYSRTVVSQTECSCDIELGRTSRSRCELTIVR
ncbi:MAG: restriction endonuclease [Phycisphaerae bacterium]|nr:restriction endonuclease [Phycisphaerae bacterium]